MACILIVEDNDFIREALAGYLKLDDHKIIEFNCQKGVIETIGREIVDLLILDIMLPDGNGFNLAKKIREISNIPLIFLTAKDSEYDRILGFEIGADDYIVKPFSTKELVLRIQAVLNRYNIGKLELADITEWTSQEDTMRLEIGKHCLLLNNKDVVLTGAEWKIFVYLSRQESIVVSRERILSDCLNYFFEGSERTIDTHIANLRAKLGASDWIETVRGYGYRFTGKRVAVE